MMESQQLDVEDGFGMRSHSNAAGEVEARHADASSKLKPGTQGNGLVLDLPEGRIAFTREEGFLFGQLFCIVDADEDKLIGGNEGATFLRRARLGDEVLREVWRLACGGRSRPVLGQDEWFVACKLVSLAQTGVHTLSRDPLFRGEPLELPDFGIMGIPFADFSVDTEPNATESECHVKVSDPVTMGSGLSKYTLYTITLETSLPYFHRSHAMVKRRYSDFRWLHKRLRKLYPATILPPLPSKKYVGNMDARFIEERRIALELYLNAVGRHPKLGQCFEVQVILDASQTGLSVFKRLVECGILDQRSHTSQSNQISDPGTASMLQENLDYSWISRIVRKASHAVGGSSPSVPAYSLEESGDGNDQGGISREEMKQVRKSLQVYERQLLQVIDAIQEFIVARRSNSYELARLGAYFQSIADMERPMEDKFKYATFRDQLQGLERRTSNQDTHDDDSQSQEIVSDSKSKPLEEQPPPPPLESSANFMEKVGLNMDAVANHQQDVNDEVTTQIIAGFQFQLRKIKSVRRVLQCYDHQVVMLRDAHDDLALSKKQHASARAMSASGESKAVEDAERNVKIAQSRIQQTERILQELHVSISLEMGRFQREKIDAFGAIMNKLIEAETMGSRKHLGLLQSFLN